MCSKGDLLDYLMCGHFSETLARTYFQKFCLALKACHENNVAHCDIKPDNIFLNEEFDLKLGDFGMAQYVYQKDTLLSEYCGTKSYMSPEIHAGEFYSGFQSDIWSAGVLLFIMLTGFPPFQIAKQGDWWFDRVKEKRYNRFWDAHIRGAPHIKSETQKFINFILQADADDRPSIEEILQHDWMINKSVLNDDQLKKVMSIKYKDMMKMKATNRQEEQEMDYFFPCLNYQLGNRQMDIRDYNGDDIDEVKQEKCLKGIESHNNNTNNCNNDNDIFASQCNNKHCLYESNIAEAEDNHDNKIRRQKYTDVCMERDIVSISSDCTDEEQIDLNDL